MEGTVVNIKYGYMQNENKIRVDGESLVYTIKSQYNGLI